MAENKTVLGYWGIRGVAAPLRLLLAYTEMPHVDKVHTNPEHWFSHEKSKLNSDFPNLPYLIHGDKTYTESEALYYAISHFANKPELAGASPNDVVQMKTAEGVVRDMRKAAFNLITDENYEKTKEDVWNKTFKPKLDGFQKVLQGKKWLLGDNISYADFQMYDAFKFASKLYPEQFKNYADLEAYIQRFEEIPQIKNCLESESFRLHNRHWLGQHVTKWHVAAW